MATAHCDPCVPPKMTGQARDLVHLVGPGARGAAGLGPAGDRPAGWVAPGLQRGAAGRPRTRGECGRECATSGGRCRGRERARATDEALGIFMHDVHRRWGSVVWRSWLMGARHSMRKSRPLNLCAQRATAEPQSAVVEYEYRQTPSCASAALECSGLASAQRRREFVRGLVPANAVVMLVMPNAERCLAIARRAASRVRAPEFLSMTFRELLPRT